MAQIDEVFKFCFKISILGPISVNMVLNFQKIELLKVSFL